MIVVNSESRQIRHAPRHGEAGQLIPAEGVYAGQASLISSHSVPDHYAATAKEISEPIAAAISIGRNPTFDETELSVEAFLLDFKGDIYEQAIRLEFFEWLRPQQKFSSPEALAEQIGLDVAQTRVVFASK